MDKISKAENTFFAEIAFILKEARSTAYKAVNSVMVQTYWKIGQRIVEQEQQSKDRAKYGDYLISSLSKYLGDNFGKGFSEANLKNMRQFFLTFPEFDEFATHCVANLSWTNIRLIMRLDNKQERDYYLKEAPKKWIMRENAKMMEVD
jgi:hypothetical protein